MSRIAAACIVLTVCLLAVRCAPAQPPTQAFATLPPTADTDATVQAAIAKALPSPTPTPTPNIAATIEVSLAATISALRAATAAAIPTSMPSPAATPTATPQPTPIPTPTTAPPTSTATAIPAPTATQAPAPTPVQAPTATLVPTATPVPTPVPATPTVTLRPTPTSVPTATANPLIAAFSRLSTGVTVRQEGGFWVITSNSTPNHPSPYFARTDSRYQSYNGTNPQYAQNPNRIVATTLICRIPVEPGRAGSSMATPLGPIGIAINGVPFFNQYAGPNQPLTMEINSFDQYGGHPQQFGQYHYHLEPTALTAQFGKGALLGYLLDGFPVYGPEENGRALRSSDLDANHGHAHATAEYPSGIYHYHFTADNPYLNGTGYYGTPGTTPR